MKKLSIILVVVSMILTMTQCKKNVQDIVATDAGTIFISLDVNKGNRIDVNTANGTRSALDEIHNNDYITTGYTVTVGTATTANPTYDDRKFSLSADKRVTFASGNVQHVYDKTNGQWIWKFAEHQYHCQPRQALITQPIMMVLFQ